MALKKALSVSPSMPARRSASARKKDWAFWKRHTGQVGTGEVGIPASNPQGAVWEYIWLCGTAAHNEFGKGKLPLCAVDLSVGGIDQHRQNAAVQLWRDRWEICGDECCPSIPWGQWMQHTHLLDIMLKSKIGQVVDGLEQCGQEGLSPRHGA